MLAVLQNYEGVRFRTMEVAHFREEIEILMMERLRYHPNDVDCLVPVRRRRFQFFDREGRKYIFKEA